MLRAIKFLRVIGFFEALLIAKILSRTIKHCTINIRLSIGDDFQSSLCEKLLLLRYFWSFLLFRGRLSEKSAFNKSSKLKVALSYARDKHPWSLKKKQRCNECNSPDYNMLKSF